MTLWRNGEPGGDRTRKSERGKKYGNSICIRRPMGNLAASERFAVDGSACASGSADFDELSRVELAAGRNPQSAIRVPSSSRSAFTLLELMVTVAIIGILASAMLFALFGAQETARENKTKSLILKLNNIIMPKWETYRTRRVPIIPPMLATQSGSTMVSVTQGVQIAAKYRLDALHDIMRMEMPDRWSDITDAPITLFHPDQAYSARTLSRSHGQQSIRPTATRSDGTRTRCPIRGRGANGHQPGRGVSVPDHHARRDRQSGRS